MAKPTNSRLDAIVRHWANLAQYYGGANAKRYRGNLKRASTAARETADLFSRMDNFEDRQLLAKDIATLRDAAQLLAALADDFEVAQRKADKIKTDRERQRAAEYEARIKTVEQELFGHLKAAIAAKTLTASEAADQILAMARDLVEFDKIGAEQYGHGKGCSRGLVGNAHRIYDLEYAVKQGDTTKAARILAENRDAMYAKGRASTDRHDTRWYHAGWEDFIAWRQLRQTVKAEEGKA